MLSGIGTGGTFPAGVTTEIYAVVNAMGDSAICSFTVTVSTTITATIARIASIMTYSLIDIYDIHLYDDVEQWDEYFANVSIIWQN